MKMAIMTPRQRVIAALEHRQPDRVPIDLGGNQTGIHVRAYKRVLVQLGIHEDKTVLSHFTQQLARPCDALLDRFRIDTRWIRPLAGYLDYDRQEPQHERGFAVDALERCERWLFHDTRLDSSIDICQVALVGFVH